MPTGHGVSPTISRTSSGPALHRAPEVIAGAPTQSEEATVPAVTVEDILSLPKIPEPDATTVLRPVRQVTTAPAGFEGEGSRSAGPSPGPPWPSRTPSSTWTRWARSSTRQGEPRGTPWHPHRGFETVTYMIDGTFQHQDSIGGGGLITNGDTQWMTAGAGILHIERPPETLVAAAASSTGSSCGSTCRRPTSGCPPLPGHRRRRRRPPVLARRRGPGPGDRRVGGHGGPGVTHTPITMLHVTL